MEELISAVNRLADSIANNGFPIWASAVGIIVPILLTGLTIYLSINMDRRNKELQITLSNRDMVNQTRQCVLDIYNAYFNALSIAAQANGNIAEIFVSDQSYLQWAQDIEKADTAIIGAFNRAKLMLEDDAMMKHLRTAQEAFSQFSGAVKAYIYTGIPSQTVNNAWAQFSPQYGIPAGNYFALMQNRTLGETFSKMCETSYTKDIQNKLIAYIDVAGTDAFDEVFKRHVQIKEL